MAASAIGGIMTTGAAVLPESATVDQALAQFVEGPATTLPIVDHAGVVTGVISDKDVLRLLSWPGCPEQAEQAVVTNSRVLSRPVTGVMRRHPIVVSPRTSIAAASDLLACTDLESVPVAQDGRLVGVVTRANLLGALAETTGHGPPLDPDSLASGERGRVVQAVSLTSPAH